MSAIATQMRGYGVFFVEWRSVRGLDMEYGTAVAGDRWPPLRKVAEEAGVEWKYGECVEWRSVRGLDMEYGTAVAGDR